jgi:uncharacterized protein
LLAGARILLRSSVGNQVHYQADTSCQIHVELQMLMRKLNQLRYPPVKPRLVLRVADSASPKYLDAEVGGSAKRAFVNLKIERRLLSALCRRHHVKRLAFFGSVTRPDFRPASDVDVLVEFLPNQPTGLGRMVDLREELSSLFGGRRVDIATPAILKNPHRRGTIDRDLSVVYESR